MNVLATKESLPVIIGAKARYLQLQGKVFQQISYDVTGHPTMIPCEQNFDIQTVYVI